MRKWLVLSVVLSAILHVSIIYADTSSVSVTVFTGQCADGVDNDGDTLVDYPLDPGCSNSIDDDETDPVVTYQCNDGSDNDSDGKTDYPTDLGCDSTTDNSESGEIVNSGGGNGPVGNSGNVHVSGTQVIFQGQAPLGSSVTVLANGISVASALTNSAGRFSVLVNELTPRVYIFNIYATDGSGRNTKPLSYAIKIARGTITQISGVELLLTVPALSSSTCSPAGDLNTDCRVDIVDFSIAAYWWGRTIDSDFVEIEIKELNGDGEVDIEDFSILAYYWTG